jgi:flagellar hook assembly protein FlgD
VPLLGSARLGWQVSDSLSTSVHVQVLVYNALGQVVRSLDSGSVPVTPGQIKGGSTAWDGHDDTLTGLLPIGTYYYRVVVTDQAGNAAQSVESKPLQISLLPAL